ncbi:MAG: class I SAM-dependent methyltransferase [Acidobacteriota bacterium]
MSHHARLGDVAAGAAAAGAPPVDDATGRFLHVLARALGARRILEIGTGIGASTLYLATALPGEGMLITLEKDRPRAERARQRADDAGVGALVTVMIGEAGRYLHKIAGPFDLVFEDAGPEVGAALHDRLVALVRPGGVLVTHGAGSHASDDGRLVAAHLPLGGGLTLSVKRP